ncbi:hypothetical protein NFI96_019867 [Prochilodus magdalenae]|nr:hypothetical protein NFI96_019867 [Prochilodus magdalenae]
MSSSSLSQFRLSPTWSSLAQAHSLYNPPAPLVQKYGNLSKGACKPGYAAAKMTANYPNFGSSCCSSIQPA